MARGVTLTPVYDLGVTPLGTPINRVIDRAQSAWPQHGDVMPNYNYGGWQQAIQSTQGITYGDTVDYPMSWVVIADKSWSPPAPRLDHYVDQWQKKWRQIDDGTAAGSWQRLDGVIWIDADPNDVLGYDPDAYKPILYKALDYFQLLPTVEISPGSYDFRPVDSAAPLNPYSIGEIFTRYPNFQHQGGVYNPYYTPDNTSALRAFAVAIGLKPSDADEAAIAEENAQVVTYGQPYSEATHPLVVGDRIAKRLAAKAGIVYPGLTDEEIAKYQASAANLQENIKGHREAYEDASNWYNAAQAISVFLPVIGYAAGAAASAISAPSAAGAGAGTASATEVAAVESTGAASAAGSSAGYGAAAGSAGVFGTGLTWAQIIEKGVNYIGKIVASKANQDVPAFKPPSDALPDFADYVNAQNAAQQQAAQEKAMQELEQLKTLLNDPKAQLGLGLAAAVLIWKLAS